MLPVLTLAELGEVQLTSVIDHVTKLTPKEVDPTKEYPASKTKAFGRTREIPKECIAPKGFSNFSPHPVVVNGLTFPTTEHLYQCLRFPDAPEAQRAIIDTPGPGDAKKVAHSFITKTHECWEGRYGRVAAMAYTLAVKLAFHPLDLYKAYLGVPHYLVEHSPWDTFWGTQFDANQQAFIGQNVLGELLNEYAFKLSAARNFIQQADPDSVAFEVESPNPIFKLLSQPIEHVYTRYDRR